MEVCAVAARDAMACCCAANVTALIALARSACVRRAMAWATSGIDSDAEEPALVAAVPVPPVPSRADTCAKNWGEPIPAQAGVAGTVINASTVRLVPESNARERGDGPRWRRWRNNGFNLAIWVLERWVRVRRNS